MISAMLDWDSPKTDKLFNPHFEGLFQRMIDKYVQHSSHNYFKVDLLVVNLDHFGIATAKKTAGRRPSKDVVELSTTRGR